MPFMPEYRKIQNNNKIKDLKDKRNVLLKFMLHHTCLMLSH